MRARTSRDLLTALLDACRRGVVTHCEAARLLGIRKEDFGDLVAWRMVEVAVWRAYASAFNKAFPECDARLWRVPSAPIKADDLMRGGLAGECRHYTCDEAQQLPPSHAHLLLSELENGDTWENIGSESSLPGVLTRAPARETGWLPDYDRAA